MSFVTGMLIGRSLANSANEILERQHEKEMKEKIAENDRLKAQAEDLRYQVKNLRSGIAGYKYIRRRLHEALNEVAPDHPLADWEEQRRIINNTIDEEWDRLSKEERGL